METENKVAALRSWLHAHNVYGFLIPHADMYGSENLHYPDDYLQWLTGFTGTAGTALVTLDGAFFFMDGRYEIQARQEVDNKIFTFVPIWKLKLTDWLNSYFPPEKKLGIDPWLHTVAEAQSMMAQVLKSGSLVCMVDENPIKLIWRDRSALLQHPVRIHPLNYAGELMEDKIASCNELLKKRKIDAMVLTHLDSVCWLLNIRGDDVPYTPLVRAFVVVNAAEEVTVFSDVTAFPEEVAHYLGTIRIVPMETFPRFLSEFSEQSTVFIDPKHTPMAVQKILDNAGAQVVCGQDICLARKAVKNPKELQGARNAHLRDGVAMCMFLAWLEDFLKTGEEICESEIANRLYMFRQDASDRIERGTYLGISFPSIVAFNENAAVVHYRPRLGKDKIIKGDGLLLIDSGGQYVDGTTDVTRTLAIGNVNDAQRKIFTRVLKGLLAVSQMLFPSERSMVGCSMDVIARMVLWRAGFDYLHGTGHGVGSCLSVHESPPSLTSSRAGEAPLVEGMIMSCEPGYYREGEFGMRIENLLAVKSAVTVEGGDIPMHSFATLTLVPIDRRLIFPSLLTSAERNWIDRYHAKIIEKVTQYLDPKTQLWLEKACSPLGNLKDMLSV